MASKLFPSRRDIMDASLDTLIQLVKSNQVTYQNLIESIQNSTQRADAEECMTRLLVLYTAPNASSNLNSFPATYLKLPPRTSFKIRGNELDFLYTASHTEPFLTLYSFKDYDFSFSLFYYVRLHFLLLVDLLTS